MDTTPTMSADHLDNAAGRHPIRRNGKACRILSAILLAALIALGFGLYRHLGNTNQPAIPENSFQMPIADPPIDPNRPDLIGG